MSGPFNLPTPSLHQPPTPYVIISHVFGINSDVKNNIFYTDDEKLLYPAGNHLVVYSSESMTQKFIPIKDGHRITTIATSPQHGLVAVAVATENKLPCIIIYDIDGMKRKKVLYLSESFTVKVPR